MLRRSVPEALLTVLALTANSATVRAQLQLEFQVAGDLAGGQYGYAVASVGDFNGDGFGDVAVGANAHAQAGSGAGKVFVFFGGPSADSITDWSTAGTAGELLGSSLAGAGDVNGDGYDDLLVGAPSNDVVGTSAGRAALYFGGNPPDTIPDWAAYGETSIDFFGASVAGGRDLTGDNKSDFMVGAYRFDPPAQSNTGRVYLYAGGGPPDSAAFFTTTGQTDGERYGYALAATDDFTGDLRADYVVGAYSFDGGQAGTNAGRAWLLQGGPALLAVPVGALDGNAAGSVFGWSVADVGDVDGDSQSDLLVGAYGYPVGPTLDCGRAVLFRGGAALDSVADFTLTAPAGASIRLGFAVTGGVDLNADGLSDFAIAAPGDPTGNGKGEVYLYLGGASPVLDTTMSDGPGAGDEFGHSVAEVPNFFGSEGGLIVGAWGEGGSTGAVYFYRYAGGGTPTQQRGDVNNTGTITSSDIIYTVNYVFKGGPLPEGGEPLADVNCTGTVNSSDIIYLVNYVFKGGPLPCPL